MPPQGILITSSRLTNGLPSAASDDQLVGQALRSPALIQEGFMPESIDKRLALVGRLFLATVVEDIEAEIRSADLSKATTPG